MQPYLLILVGLVALILGGEWLVRGSSRLATALGVPALIVGLTIVAFGTGAPELAVSLQAAFKGNADIAVSNVVGSNNFNLLFILGLSAVFSPLLVHSQIIKREVPVMIGVTVLFFYFALSGEINRFEGIVLVLAGLGYTAWLVVTALQHKASNREIEKEFEEEIKPVSAKAGVIMWSLAMIVVGLVVIIYGAEWLVDGAVQVAKSTGVSDTIIGLTIVAAGTSLPEAVTSIVAALKGERDIAVANVVGSNIYNILLTAGLSSAIAPQGIAVNQQLTGFDIPFLIVGSVLSLVFFVTKSELNRIEGFVLFGSYIGYVLYMLS